jgi:hypothetical protein
LVLRDWRLQGGSPRQHGARLFKPKPCQIQ